jgi:hypothetical protein
MGNKQGLQNQQLDGCCYEEQSPGIPIPSTSYCNKPLSNCNKIQGQGQKGQSGLQTTSYSPQSHLVQNDQLLMESLDSPHIISDVDRYISSGYVTLFDQPQRKQDDKPVKGLEVQADFSYNEACHKPMTPYDISHSNEILGQGEQRESGFSPSSKVERQTISCSPRKNQGLHLLSIESFENPHTINEMDQQISISYITLFDQHENISSATHSPMQKELLSTQEYNFTFSGAVSAKF